MQRRYLAQRTSSAFGDGIDGGRKWMRQEAPIESLVEEIHVQRLFGRERLELALEQRIFGR